MYITKHKPAEPPIFTAEGCPEVCAQCMPSNEKSAGQPISIAAGCPEGVCAMDGANENGKAFSFPVRRVTQLRSL